MRLVVVESPFAAPTAQGRKDNINYLRRCLRDCLLRGEAPFASHAIYTQYGVLDDSLPDERALGITAGLCWASKGDATVVYIDRGMTVGMRQGIERAQAEGRPVFFRSLDTHYQLVELNMKVERIKEVDARINPGDVVMLSTEVPYAGTFVGLGLAPAVSRFFEVESIRVGSRELIEGKDQPGTVYETSEKTTDEEILRRMVRHPFGANTSLSVTLKPTEHVGPAGVEVTPEFYVVRSA